MTSRLVLTLHPCLAVAGTLLAVTMLVPAAPSTEQRLQVEGQKLVVESRTFRAEFDGASLVSVRSSDGNTELLRLDTNSFPLELVYANNERLRQDKGQVVTVNLLSECAARIVMNGNDSDREWTPRDANGWSGPGHRPRLIRVYSPSFAVALLGLRLGRAGEN